MLKNAILFAVVSIAVAMLAPQIFTRAINPTIESGRAEAVAPSPAAVAAAPAAAPQAAAVQENVDFRKAVLRANAYGHYRADVEINGVSVPMMVDTGASFVSLSWNTARSLGIYADPFRPKHHLNTANGVIEVSPTTVREINLQGVSMRDVEAVISPPEIAAPDLLGTSFLSRLASVEQRNGWMIMRQ